MLTTSITKTPHSRASQLRGWDSYTKPAAGSLWAEPTCKNYLPNGSSVQECVERFPLAFWKWYSYAVGGGMKPAFRVFWPIIVTCLLAVDTDCWSLVVLLHDSDDWDGSVDKISRRNV